MVECTLSIMHCLRLNLQLHTIDLVRTCRISSFCTVAWQLARFPLTRRIARALGDSWASCYRPDAQQTVSKHWRNSSSGLQTDNHTNTTSLNFYRLDARSDAQPVVSKHWRQSVLHRVFSLIFLWHCSRVVSLLDSGAEGPGFKSQLRRCRITVLGKLLTPIVPLFTKQRHW